MSKIENLKVGSTTYDITPDTVSIKDIRDIAGAPSAFSQREVTPFFTNVNMPYNGAWASGINVAGWNGNYNQWQLVGHSSEVAGDHPLHFRMGNTSTNSWYPWRTILDSKNFSDYALPVSYNSTWTANWDSEGFNIRNTEFDHTTIGGDFIKIVQEQAYGEDNLVISKNKITRNIMASYGTSSYDYNLPNVSGRVCVKNTGWVTLVDSSDGGNCICIGLNRGTEHDIEVYNEADGCGVSNTYKIIVPDCYSIAGPKPTIYQTNGSLLDYIPEGFINFDLMTQYNDYNTFWVAITVGNLALMYDSAITVSTVEGIPAILDTYPMAGTPMDFMSHFEDALPIDVIDLTAATRITNYQIDSLFT